MRSAVVAVGCGHQRGHGCELIGEVVGHRQARCSRWPRHARASSIHSVRVGRVRGLDAEAERTNGSAVTVTVAHRSGDDRRLTDQARDEPASSVPRCVRRLAWILRFVVHRARRRVARRRCRHRRRTAHLAGRQRARPSSGDAAGVRAAVATHLRVRPRGQRDRRLRAGEQPADQARPGAAGRGQRDARGRGQRVLHPPRASTCAASSAPRCRTSPATHRARAPAPSPSRS